MFVIPTWISKNQQLKTYRKQVRKTSEVVGATCKVRTIISFADKCVPKETERIINGVPMISITCQYKPSERYGFEVIVDLSKDEYEKNKNNLEEYTCEKVKELYFYQKAINDCIEKHADGRDYTVDVFVPLHDPNAIELKWDIHEYEEYVHV